jgi:endonuclease/exonuclease/phosphatase family metal-dependent hydrolase
MAERLTVITYNVHGCKGLDGRRSEERIARVLAACNADVIALQELDASRSRSAFVGQPRELAERLQMDYCFSPTAHWEEGEYGCAVLSRMPMRHVKSGLLPARDFHEPRGALWVEIDVRGRVVQVINVHLDFQHSSRSDHLDALLSDKWLGNAAFRAPGIACGDFNFAPSNPLYGKMCERLKDAAAYESRAGATWMGLRRLDYLWVTPDVQIDNVHLPRNLRARLASDHAPVVAQLRV